MLHKAGVDQPFVDALGQVNCLSSALSEPRVWRKVNWGRSAFLVAAGEVPVQQVFRDVQTWACDRAWGDLVLGVLICRARDDDDVSAFRADDGKGQYP